MKTYYVRCKNCKEGMAINVPNNKYSAFLKTCEFVCTNCVGYHIDELYQPEALNDEA